jgi:hypothetical protein
MLPCANCVTRNKQSFCHYEAESIATKRSSADYSGRKLSFEEGSRSPASGGALSKEQSRNESDSTAQFGAFGYAKTSGHNSLGIFKKIENHEGGGRIEPMDIPTTVEYSGLRHKYKSLVRQLPTREYIERLLETFFHEVNWHYYSIDEEIFRAHLSSWHSLSFSVLNKGPQELPPDLRFFPALLFQMLALALQFQQPGHDPSLDSLKYVSEMSLDDLASDYSESGSQLLSMLGKHNMTIVTIQAGFLRTSFLKNSALVTESWHSLGQTIRDAQEIGWHKDVPDRSPASPEIALERLWLAEARRRVWCNLQLWDAHMALVLGRPTQIESTDEKAVLPIDTPGSTNRKGSAPYPRSETDPPTPLTMLVYNVKLMLTIRETLILEKKGSHPNPKDYTKVEEIHKDILQNVESLPAYFRSENPDTSFDSLPDCHWLPASRQLFDTYQGFVIMTLHRPYAFTNPHSRGIALKAGLNILRAQRRLFQYLEARHYKLFNLVLSTFDAIVLVAAVYILHPTEHPDNLVDALQHFEWAMERFEAMYDRNQMAKAGLSVLKAIHPRLLKATGRQPTSSTNTTPASMSQQSTTASAPSLRNTATESPSSTHSWNNPIGNQGQAYSFSRNDSSERTTQSATTDLMKKTTTSLVPDTNISTYPAPSWDSTTIPTYSPIPQNFDAKLNFSDLQPTADLLWDGLVGMNEDPLTGNVNGQPYYDVNVGGVPGTPWQFEGEFGGDSFWNFMNQYNP